MRVGRHGWVQEPQVSRGHLWLMGVTGWVLALLALAVLFMNAVEFDEWRSRCVCPAEREEGDHAVRD